MALVRRVMAVTRGTKIDQFLKKVRKVGFEDLLRRYDIVKKEPTTLDKLKKRYDISEKSDPSRIFGDRTKYMRNIKHEGTHQGYDMYSFTDIYYPDFYQTCCPALNVHNSDEDNEVFNGNLKVQLEDLRVGIDSVISSAKKRGGKVYSFVFDKLVTV